MGEDRAGRPGEQRRGDLLARVSVLAEGPQGRGDGVDDPAVRVQQGAVHVEHDRSRCRSSDHRGRIGAWRSTRIRGTSSSTWLMRPTSSSTWCRGASCGGAGCGTAAHTSSCWMLRDELYVHRRTETKDVYPGYLDVCAGGVNAAGESYDTCAARELEEELGVSGEAGLPVPPPVRGSGRPGVGRRVRRPVGWADPVAARGGRVGSVRRPRRGRGHGRARAVLPGRSRGVPQVAAVGRHPDGGPHRRRAGSDAWCGRPSRRTWS